MNDKAFKKKVNRDIDKIKKDLATLGDDSVTGANRKFEQLTDDAKETVAGTVKTINEGVEQGMSQYNAKVRDIAERVSSGLSKKVAVYPWVTVTVSLAIGMLLGVFLKPGRQPAG